MIEAKSDGPVRTAGENASFDRSHARCSLEPVPFLKPAFIAALRRSAG